jgi:hypothetical protein
MGNGDARHSGKVMDIAGGSWDSGAPLQQWQVLADHPNQRLRFERLNDGFYLIRVMHINKVLDIAGGSAESGAGVVQWDWHGGDNQRFAVEDVGDGFCRIRAGARGSSARVIQWDWTSGANQVWRHGVPID